MQGWDVVCKLPLPPYHRYVALSAQAGNCHYQLASLYQKSAYGFSVSVMCCVCVCVCMYLCMCVYVPVSKLLLLAVHTKQAASVQDAGREALQQGVTVLSG